MGEKGAWEVVWLEEKKTLALDGETVLEYQLRWPQVEGGRSGARRLSRGYEALADRWRKRWRREVYCEACLQLAACREQARPFAPWRCGLEGEVTVQEENCLGRLRGVPGMLGGCVEGQGRGPAAAPGGAAPEMGLENGPLPSAHRAG